MRIPRPRRLPSAVRERLDLTGSEQPIAWATAALDDGTTASVVVTDRALHLPPGLQPPAADADAQWFRVPWDRVVRANWDEPLLTIVIQPRPGARSQSLAVRLPEPGNLPVVLRERVTASIVLQQHVLLMGERGARITARRDSDTAAIRWAVTFDAGLNSRDPDLRQRADEALAELRAQFGV